MLLSNYFQYGPIPADQMTGTYDWRVVLLSYLVAVFASYIALDITGRLRDISNTQISKTLWICGGACAMGAGIWSMHFIGMLAFTMPGMSMDYDPFWTGLSMLVAIFGSGFALYLLKMNVIRVSQMAAGGVLFGVAIVTMHYLGMQAMTKHVNIHYVPSIYALSIVIAMVASEAALWMALKSNQVVPDMRTRLKIISALIMGAAICGMHYTGMWAAVFTPLAIPMDMGPSLNPQLLALSIAVVTFVILGIAFFVSNYKEAINLQQLETARQAGMAEVAVSVLHNVGNVLNSLYVSSNIVAEKIKTSKLTELNSLNQMLTEHKPDLGTFITQDPRGSKIPTFIGALNDYWQTEQAVITEEMERVLKNLQHIKEIISVQQDLSKNTEIEQVVNIDALLDEAFLITGFNPGRHNIKVIKKYDKLKPILMNKIKVVQVLVNLLHNAKDSLAIANKPEKLLTLEFGPLKSNFYIKVIDNGIGISPKNLNNMFMHGFSTKEGGHGFGLHASAIAIKNLGGTMRAESDGEGKGATFTIILPYKLPRR
jgi:NO-binding membrane sensor protein with MHYT domain